MTVVDLVGRLRLADVGLAVQDGCLVIDSRSGLADDRLITDIRRHERELIEELARGSIPPVEHSGPAAIYQKRFVVLHARMALPAVLNVTLRLDISGPLDCRALARAASALVRRHHALRTSIRGYGEHVVQEVNRAQPVTLPVTALDPGQAGERREAVDLWCRQQASIPFDLDGESFIRFALARAGDDQWVLMIVQHHMITDATSTAVLLSDLAALYRAEVDRRDAALPPPSAQQIDFARWQQARLTEDYTARLVDFWRGELDGAVFGLPLPGEHPRPQARTGEGDHIHMYLPRELGERLAARAREHGATLFAVLTAAFGTLLCDLARQDEVVLIAPFQNRTRPEFETVVGELANSVPLRLRSLPAERIDDLIKRTSRQLWALADHQELPLPAILEALRITERPGAAEFPVGFIGLHPRTEQRLDMPDLRVTAADYADPCAGTDFGVLVVPEDGRLRLWAEAASYLGAQTARGWLEQYVELLKVFASQPAAVARGW